MAAAKEQTETIGVRDLLEAGVHFGHQTKRWNPKMKRYIFDKRNGIHIVDLSKSLVHLEEALNFLYGVVSSGKKILFVGTKKQAQQIIKETASGCDQFYVTHRWLGGTLTNNPTIRKSVGRMRELESMEKKDGFASSPKKEAANFRRELEKLRRNLSGVADMVEMPHAIFVVDINRESIAVQEANKLGIPVVAMVDTNCNPDPVDYVIPANDDAIRSIRLIAGAVSNVIGKAQEEWNRIAAELARKAAEEEKAAAAKAAEEKKRKKESEAAEKKAAKEEKAAADTDAVDATGTGASEEAVEPVATESAPAPQSDEPAAEETPAAEDAAVETPAQPEEETKSA